MPDVDLALFAHVSTRPEGELDLAQAALLIAEEEYPDIDVACYLERLQTLGDAAAAALAEMTPSGHERDPAHGPVRLERVVRFLFAEQGFSGNRGDYYDPRNSFLNEVLDRRTGIPITLALVLIEVCRRAGVDASGVSFPNHFLVRAPGPLGPLFVDPFEGCVLGAAELRRLYALHTGEERDPDPRLLEPATKCQILVRMLNNLRAIYAAREDLARLRGVLLRLEVLAPSDELRAQIESLMPRGMSKLVN
jgi:regulator of sirC expression with transglutaminase-like and TPR domain